MSNSHIHTTLALLAQLTRWALVAIFLAAALPKIFAPADFALSIANYKIVPHILINIIALTLPWLELVVAILLVCRFWTPAVFFLANTMLLIFLAALVSAYFRGLDIDCGCFSTAVTLTPNMQWYMIRDVFFLALGLGAACLDKHDPLA